MTRVRLPIWLLSATVVAGCSGDPTVDMPDKPKGARIISFTANPTSVRAGESATLTWETTGTTGVSIEPQAGLQPASGSVDVRPIATTEYTLQIDSAAGPLTSVVVVEVVGGPPRIEAFTATPQTVMPGQSATLEWTTSNADTVTIEPGVGVQAANGNVQVSPTVTTTYRMTATSAEGSATSEVRVVVASGNQPFVLSFTASPQSTQPGDAVTLTWQTQNADTVTIDNNVGIQPTNGTVQVTPGQTTTYNLTAVGVGGQATASVTVEVAPGGDPIILSYTASPTTVPAGGTVLLEWETDNATHVTVSGLPVNLMAKGSVQVNPMVTTTYTLTAFGNNKQITRDLVVTVAAPNEVVVLSFSATPAAVVAGGQTTLSWTTQNAVSVSIDSGVGMQPVNGSIQVSPQATTTYNLTATDASGGTATAQLVVTVQSAVPIVLSFSAQPASIVSGGSTTITWQTSGATSVTIDNGVGMQAASGSAMVTPAATTLYTLTASGPGGQASALLTVTVGMAGAPTIDTFAASPQQTTPGGSITLNWTTTNATEVTIDNGIGMQPTNGSAMITPAATTNYTLSATGPGGTTTAQVTVQVISSNGDQCASAFVITQSGQFTGNTNTAVNDYDPLSGGCTRFSAQGPDVVYQVTLQSGDRLVAALTPGTPSWDSSLYLVRNCGDVTASCVAGQDNGNPEEIDFTAAASGDYFLIVDGFRTGGAYTLDVQLNTAPIANDQCSGAIDATAGGTFSGTTRGATGDYDPGSGGCTRFAEASTDVTYSVNLAAGERLQATLTTTWDSAIYLTSDCANVTTGCLAGQDDGNPEELDFTAPQAGLYFIIVDGYAQATGSFNLDVVISPPVQGGDTCQTAVPVPGGGGSFQSTTTGLNNDYEPPTSCVGFNQRGPDQVYAATLAAGDVVEVLAEFIDPAPNTLDGSVYVTTDCANLQTSCVAGSDSGLRGADEAFRFVARQDGAHYIIVDASLSAWSGMHDLTVTQYNGETCADAAPLGLDNTAEWFTTAGRANDYTPNPGGCTSFSADAGDRTYSVALQAGDQLQVSVAPEAGYDPSVYLVSDCADVNGSCVAGADAIGPGTETLAAMVQQPGSYFLVLDGFNGSTGAGTLTATIAHGDTCDDAYLIPAGGGTFAGTTTGYSADYGITTRTDSCTNWQQEGPDAAFRVELAAGQRLQASLSTSWDSSLYLVTDCAAAATTCVAGSDSGDPETIDFTNDSGQAQTYLMIVDSWRTTISGNYALTVTIN